MRYLLFAFTVILLDTIGCGRRNHIDPDPSFVNVDKTSLTFTSDAGQQVVSVTSNTSWSISGTAIWCRVSPMSGSNNQSVVVSVNKNLDSSSRKCILTINSNDGVTREVVVEQSITSNPLVGTWQSQSSHSDDTRMIVAAQFSTSDVVIIR